MQKRNEDWEKLNDNDVFSFGVREIIEISSTNRKSDKNTLVQPEWRRNCLFHNQSKFLNIQQNWSFLSYTVFIFPCSIIYILL